MRRLIVGVGACLLVLLSASAAGASCAVLPGERSDRLLRIAAGHVDADVAFIGRVVDRHDFKRHGTTRQAVVFQVIATFAGSPLQQRTLVGGPACDTNGLCVEGGEDQHYRGPRLQLVLADRERGVGLVSQSVCSETGSLTAGEVHLMLHGSTLPMTGAPVSLLLLAGVSSALFGAGLIRHANRG